MYNLLDKRGLYILNKNLFKTKQCCSLIVNFKTKTELENKGF